MGRGYRISGRGWTRPSSVLLPPTFRLPSYIPPYVRAPCLLPAIPALLMGACAAPRAGRVVTSVDFEGNERPLLTGWTLPHSDRALRNAMVHPTTTRTGFLFPKAVEPAWLDPATLATDAWRIEMWYANHGWYDARFLGWEVVAADRLVDLRPALTPVKLVGHVEQGLPSVVRGVTVGGVETLQRPTQRRVQQALGVVQGETFDAEAWQEAQDTVRTLLQEQSYAHATVEGRAEVYPEEHAVDVALDVRAGPRCTFGPVTIVGTKKVPERIVRDYLTIEEGKPFRASKLATTRSNLFGLRVFSIVNVVPDLSDPDAAVVPVRVEVREGKTRTMELGPGFEIESGESTVFLEADWRDDNVVGRLWRMEQHTRVGVAALTDLGGGTGAEAGIVASPVVPVADVEGTVAVPHVAGPVWGLAASGHVELGIQPGYRYFSPEFSPSMTFRPSRRLTVTGGWKLEYNDLFDETITLETQDYLLMMLFQRVAYDGRDDALYTTRGSYWSVGFGEAGGPFGGNYRFLLGQAELRGYFDPLDVLRVDTDTVLAGRVGGGATHPWGEGAEATVPEGERLYLGGGTTVRGWAADHMGDTEDGVPVGGELALYANAEVRQRLPFYPDVNVVLFTDVGQLWPTVEDFAASELQWSVGAGLRYRTSVGPIRLDFAWRLANPEPTFLPALHFGLAEAF